MILRIINWIDERTGILAIWNTVFDRKVPKVNWWYTLGSASLFLAVMQAFSGIFLTLYYVPSEEDAYKSIEYIMNEVTFGWLIRGIHHWGASLMVIVVFLHMLRVLFYGAYKYPREFTWVTGMVLLLVTVSMGFSGYLLPWNQKAYWATTVGTNIIGLTPIIGSFLLRVVRGGDEVTFITLARFFGAHVWFLPAVLFGTIGVHLYLVVRNGISKVPSRDE